MNLLTEDVPTKREEKDVDEEEKKNTSMTKEKRSVDNLKLIRGLSMKRDDTFSSHIS